MFNLQGAHLQGASLRGAHLQGANLATAHLQGARLEGAVLENAHLEVAELQGAHLQGAYLEFAVLENADLRGADLRGTRLIRAILDGAILTDACLWETQRARWSIQGVVCEVVYWNEDRAERTTYAPGEFERLYADKIKIILHYKGGINPIEIATLPALIQQIEGKYPGCVLRLCSIEEASSGATVTLVVDDRGEIDPAEIGTMKAELEEAGRRLISVERRALQAEAQQRQVEYTLRYLSHEVFPKLVQSVHPRYAINITGGRQTMGDTFIAGQVGAQGPGAHAHDMTFDQRWNQLDQGSIWIPGSYVSHSSRKAPKNALPRRLP
jgi:Pentapeptide repeats (8 copies)